MHLDEFLRGHGISEDIGGHGRYVRFEKGEIDLVMSHYEGFDTKTKRLAKTVAGQAGGFIIVRRRFGRRVPPQLRPDDPVFTSNLRRPSYHPTSGTRPRPLSHKGQTVWPLRGTQLERHLLKWHDGVNVEHLHFHRHAAKYVLPPGSYGKRLDVPMLHRLPYAGRVFFVIEGSLKTDAILSAGEAAFGVPSVTLWEAPELPGFIRAMNLHNKQVVIVPDADWVNNPMVVMQAMLCRTYLREQGVKGAIVAAPPLVGGEVEVVGDVKRKGVDDHLALGGTLDELAVLEREACDWLATWKAAYRFHGQDARAVNRITKALRTLPLFADGNGQLIKSVSMFSSILRCNRRTARKTIVELAEAQLIDVEGSLDAGYQHEDRKTGDKFNYDWDERPRITFNPEFRATELAVRLGELSTPRPLIRASQTQTTKSETRSLV